MCKSDVGIIMLIIEAPLFNTASMSSLVPLAALLIFAFNPCSAISLTDSISPSETAANPASIASTPSSSRRLAILNLFSEVKETPGVCSPSLRVVSKILTCFGKRLGLDKAIPHFTFLVNSLGSNKREYKIYGP